MIEDAENLAEDRFGGRAFDVCIAGAGPAGITLARRLAAGGLRVGLFEAGGLDYTEESQILYKGRTFGQPYYPLDGCRLRYFGGTSNHWGGWTRPLDAEDFGARPHHPLSGWPIRKADLDPYAAEADAILDLPDAVPAPDILGAGGAGLVQRRFRFSRPITRFGEKYRDEIKTSRRIEAFINANLVDLQLDDRRRAVAEAVFRSYRRREPFRVRARVFALCLGGLETPRLLLNADRQVAGGLGNAHDLVGRYFLEHPHAPVGRVALRRPLEAMLVYSPTPAMMAEQSILSFGLRIGDIGQWNAPDFTGALRPEPPCKSPFPAILAAEMSGRAPPCPAHVGDVFVAAEQTLDPANRVRLTGERDGLGLRRIALDWRLSDMDLRTIRTAALTTARLLAERDTGRMKMLDWVLAEQAPTGAELWGGNHHMGTTRMSADPRSGVVDANCKLHSLANLYIGGSSVFATSGHANPTYTIVQLALRLGDHLDRLLRQK